MKKFLIFFSLFLFADGTLLAQETPRQRVETMFASFKPGEMDRAIDVFVKGSSILPEAVDALKTQVKTVFVSDKKVIGAEFIQEQNVGESVKRLTYILKLNDQPLFWSFSFYKPGNVWIPFKTSFSEEF